jgi:hypothetical protein
MVVKFISSDDKWQWTRLWCTCDPNGKSSAVSLYYYKDEHNTAELGFIDLADTLVYKCSIPKKGITEFCFVIRRMRDDICTWLCAESEVCMWRELRFSVSVSLSVSVSVSVYVCASLSLSHSSLSFFRRPTNATGWRA